ncbi:MAG: hypothetical protein EA415_07640 [Sphaerobacteraceae bacterium]|nr:MAG: hypothetical protein EA415_07640 [Sphaerobacteraceae bacterium]
MSNQDRTLLDQINDTWDDRVENGRTSSQQADEFTETIDALHRASPSPRPSPEFRARLKQQLSQQASGIGSDRIDDTEPVGESPPVPTPIDAKRNGDDDMQRRRTLLSHAGELAAIVAILIVAAVGVALWQSGDSGMLPGAAGDDNEEVVVPTPEPTGPGLWENVTLDEVEALAPYDLIVPGDLPEGYELDSITVANLTEMAALEDYDLGEREDGEPFVTTILELRDAENLIELAFQNAMSPALASDQPEQVPGSGAYPGPPVDLSRGDLYVDGVEIMHASYNSGQEERLQHTWFQDGLTVHLTTSSSTEAEQHGMELIESIVSMRQNEDQPPVAHGFGTPSDDDVPQPEEQPDPHPEEHLDLTIDEARELVEFDLIDPVDVHPDYEINSIDAMGPPVGDIHQVGFVLHHSGGPGRTLTIQLFQQTSPMAIPNVDTMPESAADDVMSDTETSGPVQEELDMDGITVVRSIQYNLDGDEYVTYNWAQNETSLSLHAVTGFHEDNGNDFDHIHEIDDLDQIVLGIIERRTSDDPPPEPDGIEQPSEEHQSGGEREVSLDEARELMPFDLIDHDALPGHLQFAAAAVRRTEDGQPVEPDHPDIDQPNTLSLHYVGTPDQDHRLVLEITQTTDTIPNPEGEMLEISGHEVERVGGTMGTGFQVAWIWTVDDITYGAMLTIDNPDGHESVEQFSEEQIPESEMIAPIIESTLE